MSQYKYLLFDMDGTLVNSAIGILAAVQYTQARLCLPVLEQKALVSFLGPPLKTSFQSAYSMDEASAIAATDVFREYYSAKGRFECKLYPGIKENLARWQQKGYALYVATSKPTVFARQIAEQLGIYGYFVDVVGSNLDNTRSCKQDVIQYILEQVPAPKTSFLMIGDKSHDIIGAKACGIDSVGVTYGFGSYEELAHEKPIDIVNDIQALCHIIEK